MATTGAQAEWRRDPDSRAAWHRTDVVAWPSRSPQMALVSTSTLEAEAEAEAELAPCTDVGVELVTERWTGYGRDRVYVSLPDGLRVGWLNLLTGERVVAEESFAELVRVSLDAWLDDPDNADVGPTVLDDEVTIDLRDGAPIRAFLTRRLRRNQLAH